MVGGDAADFADARPVLGSVGSTVLEACGVDEQAVRVIPLGAVVAQLVTAVRAHGDGGPDHTALLGGSRTALRPERVNLGLERSQRD